MVRYFSDDSTVATRALQIYLILIGMASNRQSATYGILCDEYLGYKGAGVISRQLGCIMGWCYENGLPALTSLVVNSETGAPGEGLTTVDGDDFYGAQQRVFERNWFSIFPPSVEELKAAGDRAMAGTLKEPAAAARLAAWN